MIQLSLDYGKPPEYHYALAKELAALRSKGVLIVGSGNMVHNLRMVAWDKVDVPGCGYDWAQEANEKMKRLILDGDHTSLVLLSGKDLKERWAPMSNCGQPGHCGDVYNPLHI